MSDEQPNKEAQAIAAREEAARDEERKKLEEIQKTLAICGLKTSDFISLVSVFKTNGGELVVRTAERIPRSPGMKNNSYLRSWTDGTDRGMQVYLFKIPGIEGTPDKNRA